jgi:drug/metabolite transporter (DMT)-like permease
MVQSPRSAAAAQALLVVFIWSTSFVLTKWAFRYGFRPLTLSGIRFGLAALVLTPLALSRARRPSAELAGRQARAWWVPVALGLAGYAVNTGGYNVGLYSLAPAEVALLLGLNNTVQVLFWGRLLLGERPNPRQLTSIAAGLVGVALYYRGTRLSTAHPAAIAAVLLAGVGYALWIVGNRHFVGRRGSLDLTRRSMTSGATILLIIGLSVDGVPHVAPVGWLIVVVLALVNTAFAFVLWGHTQKVLKSYESVVINNTQTVQVSLLALVLLGDSLSFERWTAILIVTGSAIVVQIAGSPNRVELVTETIGDVGPMDAPTGHGRKHGQ